MNEQDLANYIAANGVNAELLLDIGSTPTVAAASDTLGVAPEQITKSVLFLADGQPILVVANGQTRIDAKALADYLGVARRRVRVANAARVQAETGFAAGGVPPFGHRQPIRTIVETGVLDQQQIYGGAGSDQGLMRISVAELRRLVGEETAALAA